MLSAKIVPRCLYEWTRGYLFCCDNLYYEFSFLTFFGGGGLGGGGEGIYFSVFLLGDLFQCLFVIISLKAFGVALILVLHVFVRF